MSPVSRGFHHRPPAPGADAGRVPPGQHVTLGTRWRGVPVEALLEEVAPVTPYVMAFSDGGYTTNLPVADVTGGKVWVAYDYDGGPLAPEHGGPARLLVPHLYFWKSAKWVRGLDLREENTPGFWENYGYHLYGDPWKEQRYAGD
jgi:DMSO/TMAO reductase YedYZ molybdopterin-dependent catalytic subunit